MCQEIEDSKLNDGTQWEEEVRINCICAITTQLTCSFILSAILGGVQRVPWNHRPFEIALILLYEMLRVKISLYSVKGISITNVL